MDLQRALADGETFVKNGQDEMERKILREDQLYFIDNQVEAIDVYLSDTEDMAAGSAPLADLRNRLRDVKMQLLRKVEEFEAQEQKLEVAQEASPKEQAEAFVDLGKDMVKLADRALRIKVKKVDEMPKWEEPLLDLKGFLADTETLTPHSKELATLRADVKSRKLELEKRCADMIQSWRQSDLSGGDDEDEE